MRISKRTRALRTKRNMLSPSLKHTLFPSSFLALNITRIFPFPSPSKKMAPPSLNTSLVLRSNNSQRLPINYIHLNTHSLLLFHKKG